MSDLVQRFQKITCEMYAMHQALEKEMATNPCDVDILTYWKNMRTLSERVTPDIFVLMSEDSKALIRVINPNCGK